MEKVYPTKPEKKPETFGCLWPSVLCQLPLGFFQTRVSWYAGISFSFPLCVATALVWWSSLETRMFVSTGATEHNGIVTQTAGDPIEGKMSL